MVNCEGGRARWGQPVLVALGQPLPFVGPHTKGGHRAVGTEKRLLLLLLVLLLPRISSLCRAAGLLQPPCCTGCEERAPNTEAQ